MTTEQIEIITNLLNSTNFNPREPLTHEAVQRLALAQFKASQMLEQETGVRFVYESLE